MQLPLVISFKGLASSPAVEARIRSEAEKLERFHGRITSCRVTVEEPHRHSQHGRLFHVRIQIVVPGRQDLVVKRAPSQHQAHEDPYVAIRDAFDAARRQLQDHVRVSRGKVKFHEAEPQGRIARLLPDGGYGFIETADGSEVYFHRNAVINADFDDLAPGTAVRFVEELGDKGLQASTVDVVGTVRAKRSAARDDGTRS